MSTSIQFQCSASVYLGKLRICFYTLVSCLLIPIGILVSIPFLAYRKFHQFWTKSCNKNILKILDPLAQIAAHDFFKPHPRLNIVTTLFGEGQISIETLQGHIRNLIAGGNGNVSGDPNVGKSHLTVSVSAYAELACRVVKLGGFFYWQKIQNFDIKEYVRIYSRPKGGSAEPNGTNTTTESDLKQIVATLTSDPWDHGRRSPWEFLVINNYIDNSSGSVKCVIILRMHHHMGDGYSILSFLKRLGAGNFKESATPHSNFKRKASPGGGLAAKLLLAPLVFPYQLALMIDTFTRPKNKSWRLTPEQCLSAGDKYFHSWSSGVPLATVKAIKNGLGVSFQAVLNCVVGGAIYSLMKRIKKENNAVEISTFLPIPLPGHPGGLCNYVGYLLLNLPIGDITGPMERLNLATQELSALSKSAFPIISHIVYNFTGLFPGIVTGHVTSAITVGNSILFSPFPGLVGDYDIGGCKVSYAMFTLGTGWGDAGATITTSSSQEQVRFTLSIDQHLCQSQDILDEFNSFVQEEVQLLMKCVKSKSSACG